MSARTRLNIFSLVVVAIGAVLVYIWESGMLKTDNDYWTVFILLMAVCIVSLPIMGILIRKSFLEAEQKRVKKIIDKNNEDK